MRFPEAGRRCVVYIGEETDKGFQARGTGFLVEVERANRTLKYYLVTAHHVIRRLPEPSRFSIRINHKSEKSHNLRSFGRWRWWRHSDRSVDAAVYPWSLDVVEYPHSAFQIDKYFVKPDPTGERGIGVGDPIYMVGLFRTLAGSDKITPMVRSGNIAMMASEPFRTKYYGDALYHWIETFSLKGFSGSPVFARETIGTKLDKKKGNDAQWLRGHGDLYLLGLVHGILPLRVLDELTGVRDSKQVWHSGITMVVPAHLIMEILNRPELLEYEKHIMKEPGEREKTATSLGGPKNARHSHSAN